MMNRLIEPKYNLRMANAACNSRLYEEGGVKINLFLPTEPSKLISLIIHAIVIIVLFRNSANFY